MAADLGGSQISALLESVPGIRNVLRSPVADALVNTIRAAVGLRPFAFADAEELIQYAVRRGLINQSEGDQVIQDVRGTPAGRSPKAAAGGGRKPAVAKKPPARRPPPRKALAAKPGRTQGPAKSKPATSARRPVKKR
ncbi:MAG TPA: hypothetical protein VGA02_06780 [Gemmatimonadales bacterium]|jgi:hypothetical protein